MGKYLKRWGLTLQRLDKRAVEQDAEAVRLWYEETWSAIRARAKADNGEVLFGERSAAARTRSPTAPVGEQGRTPVIRRTGNWFSVNAMSAISTKGRTHVMVFTESFDAKAMCRFLARLVRHYDRKAHLIVDCHSATDRRLSGPGSPTTPTRSSCIPSYSPELNPDELVNSDLKRSLPHTHRAKNQAELAAETRRFFKRRQRQPRIVGGLFGGRHVRYVLDEQTP
ncbi:transposase [Streptomyces sp. NPDC058740]|uniref:transposase n=1 Tax=Streptomyces sp. NPDC058740 TaxID=3346619 RepID=UPI0036A39774